MQKNWQKLTNKNIWLKVLLIFLAWRLLLVFVTSYSVTKIHRVDYQNPVATKSFLLQATLQWDSKYYLEIASNGYGKADSALPAFFPLYPAMLHEAKIIGIDPIVAGSIINLVAGYFSLLFLYLLALDYFKNNKLKSSKAILLFLFFPTAFFLSVFYTEALFCALAFGAFYFAKKDRWLATNVLLAPLTATRLIGAIFAIAILIEYFAQRKFNFRKIDRKIFWFLLAPLGLVTYMIFLNMRYHDLLLFQHAYKFGWSYDRFSPNIFSTIYQQLAEFARIVATRVDVFTSERLFDGLIFLGAWIFALIIFIRSWKRLSVSYLFLGFASLALFLLKGNFTSVSRYILPLFPIYFVLTDWLDNHSIAYNLFLASSASLMIVLAILFANGYWVG